jgi:hypothetical protein
LHPYIQILFFAEKMNAGIFTGIHQCLFGMILIKFN